MNEKLKQKYPNLHTTHDYEKLAVMLKHKAIATASIILSFGSPLVLFALKGLFTNKTLFYIILVGLMVLGLFGYGVHNQKVDHEFIAKAKKHPVNQHRQLTPDAMIENASAKRIRSMINISFLTLIFVAILAFFTLRRTSFTFTDEVITELCWIISIALALIIITIIVSKLRLINQKNKITKGLYKILKCKLSHKEHYTGSGDSNAEYYYLHFECGEYGKFKYSATKDGYLCAQPKIDEYYLLVTPKKKQSKFKLIEIYSAENWYCPNEATSVIVIPDTLD